ncbi:folylpolyglutamate synthase/dihydrofolate synthase family protein [Clostridium boliviensis]|uniref:Folylpolyglutamate synthase/dihydrofolate synthase family protein n=2 Tax=Clostridium boliviensis TaxID=318465 RepID=A0ABU4GGR9_9CLOT|nr:folylpolyglutamate synthase/dihydrofolate synthase family protein [Clostridium boliviensis]
MRCEETAEEYISRIPMWTKKKNSLEVIRTFLMELGEPDEAMRIIHVAGTNGKGSVCAFLQSVFLQAGYQVGTFTSPHLIEIRERFCVNGEMTSESAFSDSFKTVQALSERMMKRGYSHPSYFEFLFYMAMDLFRKSNVDLVILEVGLGGRLDTTNVIRHPLVSVITSVSMDHMEYLGDTVEKIASEKAGIIKKNIPVVFDGNQQNVSEVIRNRALEQESPYYETSSHCYRIIRFEDNRFYVEFTGVNGHVYQAVIPSVARYQVMNALLALRAAEVSGLLSSERAGEQIREGFLRMNWPARMEEVYPGVFLDGAHNPGGIEEFVWTALNLCTDRKKRANLLFSAVSDKNYHDMIKMIGNSLPLDEVAVTHIDSDRGLETDVIFREFEEAACCTITGFSGAEEAFFYMLDKQDDDHLLFCAGSLYLMGELKAALRRNGYD